MGWRTKSEKIKRGPEAESQDNRGTPDISLPRLSRRIDKKFEGTADAGKA
jgi:hypothetical protein